MSPHPSNDFDIQKYYEKDVQVRLKNESRFNGVCSRNNLPKINDGSYVINLDEYKSIGTHWIPFYVNGDNVTCFDSFGVEHIPK